MIRVVCGGVGCLLHQEHSCFYFFINLLVQTIQVLLHVPKKHVLPFFYWVLVPKYNFCNLVIQNVIGISMVNATIEN